MKNIYYFCSMLNKLITKQSEKMRKMYLNKLKTLTNIKECQQITRSLIMGLVVIFTCSSNPIQAQDDPLYFTHDFENSKIYPSSRTATPQSFNEPYGEWIYINASSGTNSSYHREGMGERDLRMTKNNGSTVILPVLDRGAKQLFFMEGRGGRTIAVYTSEDGGETWNKLTDVNTDKDSYHNTVDINSMKVNRIKLANEGSGDADVDNISVSILAAGQKAQMATGSASDITKSSAVVEGSISDPGDKEMIEYGICWSQKNEVPSSIDHRVKASTSPFWITINGLEAGSTIYYRAYAITDAGTGYGEVKSFNTLDATLPQLSTKTARVNQVSSNHTTMAAYTGGIISDNGGAAPTMVGVVYDIEQHPTIEHGQKALANGITDDNDFDAIMKLLPNTTYYYRAFATNKAGTSYGDEQSVTTGELMTPDFNGHLIYCSPQGNDNMADGSEAAPFYSLQKAVDLAQAGDTIYMMAGTYVYDDRININQSGTEDKHIAVFAKGGRAILDFSAMPYHKHSDNPYQGIRLCGSYWHFYRIDITNASDNGMLIERNKPTGGTSADVINATDQAHDNIIEECNFYKNGDTGLQLKNLASNNYIINCDSYLNCDEGQGDADGFAPKLSVGDGNYFYGCRAWLNSDDGWDVFFKKDGGFGDNKTIILEECITYKNGFLDENTLAPDGNGNGFKMGSDQGAMNLYMNRCLAVCNKAKGFDQNHNAGDIIMNNCTGMTLKSISDKAYSYRIYESISSGHEVRLTNCIAINDNAATDKLDKNTGLPKPGEDGKYGQYGRFQVDSTLTGMSVISCEFRHAAPSEFLNVENHAELIAPRNADGTLPYSTFARLKEGSKLIDRGTKVDGTIYRGIEVAGISYEGMAPDLGAYESKSESTAIDALNVPANSPSASAGQLKVTTTAGGMKILSITSAHADRHFSLILTDATGRTLGRHQFSGSVAAIPMPQYSGILILHVEGNQGFRATIKTR